jgi:hypothetical protein
MRFCGRCHGYTSTCPHDRRKASRNEWGGWIALGVFVAMALTAVFGWCA